MQGDADIKFGMALHVIFNSIKKVWHQFDASHTVFCLEGKSWRKKIYTPYKANRKLALDKKTTKEKEEDAAFFEVMDDFVKFITEKTNCTVLRHPEAEADDMISRWIKLHPQDDHIIISSDADFQQLISKNVKIFNGIAGLLYTNNGIFDKDGAVAKNKKGQRLPVPDPEWILFEKCIRGDTSDNIMSAFPGVREKKLREAYNERIEKGFAWNNLMLSKWVDHNQTEKRVKDVYENNKLLIDLSMQPADLIEKFDRSITESIITNTRTQVGIALMRFCNTHGLVKIEKACAEYSTCLSSPYKGHLTNNLST